MKYAEKRENLLAWLHKQLVGPFNDSDKLVGMAPLDRYPTGVLFPVVRGGEGVDPVMETDNDEEEAGQDNDSDNARKVEATTKPRRYIPPSSVGFSFFVKGATVRFQVIFSAAIYRRTGERDGQGRFTGT